MANIATTYFGLRSKANDSTVGPDGKQNSYPAYVQLNGLSGSEAVGVYNNFGLGSGPMGGGPGRRSAPTSAPCLRSTSRPSSVCRWRQCSLITSSTPAVLAAAPATASASLRFSVSEPEYGYPLQARVVAESDLGRRLLLFIGGIGRGEISHDALRYAQRLRQAPKCGRRRPQHLRGRPDGTIANYTTIYLQRLANPLAPWDSTANPYLTVDACRWI